jgi:hypothetical protein
MSSLGVERWFHDNFRICNSSELILRGTWSLVAVPRSATWSRRGCRKVFSASSRKPCTAGAFSLILRGTKIGEPLKVWVLWDNLKWNQGDWREPVTWRGSDTGEAPHLSVPHIHVSQGSSSVCSMLRLLKEMQRFHSSQKKRKIKMKARGLHEHGSYVRCQDRWLLSPRLCCEV